MGKKYRGKKEKKPIEKGKGKMGKSRIFPKNIKCFVCIIHKFGLVVRLIAQFAMRKIIF